MLRDLTRSSRGLLILGAVLAVAAFALVVVLLQQKNNTSSTATATPIVVASGTVLPAAIGSATVPPQPSATPTAGFAEVVASKAVPANTRLENVAAITAYFKEIAPLPGQAVPADAVQGLQEMETKILSGTTYISALQIVHDIKRGDVLHTSDYRMLPFSPPGSFAYQLGVGRVALSIMVPPLAADNGVILPGDTVDLLLTIRQHETDSLTSSPPASTQSGAMETQQLVQGVRVLSAVNPGGLYILELPLQEALLVKYVKDSSGLIDMVLESAEDVRTQAPQPGTNPVYPEFFLTPAAQGSPVPGSTPLPTPPNGVPFAFTPVKPTPVLTPH